MTGVADLVAVVIYPGCTIVEIAEAATRLRNAEVEVIFVASTLDEFEDQSGLRMRAHRTFGEVGSLPIAAVVIPGGDALSILDDAEALSFLAGAGTEGTPIAGICAGVLIMGRAGLLEKRQITHNYRSPWASEDLQVFAAPHFVGTNVVEDRTVGVVVDTNIITALPNASVEFAMKICTLLNVYSDEHSDMVGRHLRGQFVPELYV